MLCKETGKGKQMDNNKRQHNVEFWRSLDDYYSNRHENPEKLPEFPDSVKEEFEVEKLSPVSRRKFMALLGASSAFALAACTDYRDKGEIISYNKKPEYANYGDAIYYSSSLNDGSGILIKTREGRPLKVDGNPDHPIFQGKISIQGQSSVINLYDPSRLRNPMKKSDSPLILNRDKLEKTDWETVDIAVKEKLQKAVDSGKEIALVTHSVLSPTQKKLLDEFVAKYPNTKIYSYELHDDSNRRAAWKAYGGNPDYASIDWEKANVIVALEADFLGNEGIIAEQIRGYANRRNVDKIDEFNRLYAVEAGMSLTGMNADYRLRLSPEFQLEFVLMLIKEVIRSGRSNIAGLPDLNSIRNLKQFAEKYGIDEKKLNYLKNDLVKNQGKAIVYAGDKLPKDVHIAVNMLNEILSNSLLYHYTTANLLHHPHSDMNELKGLVQKMKAGNVAILIHFDSNPAYHFPTQWKYSDAMSKVETRISLLETENESSVGNEYLLPINHDLESWNDFELKADILSLQQPVIAPLYNSRQKEAILMNWMADDPKAYKHDIYHKYLMARWQSEVYTNIYPMADFNAFWQSCLHDGVITTNKYVKTESSTDFEQLKPSFIEKKDFTVIINKNYSIGDGRWANNGWLQETPHPVSKAAWDNYAAIAPATAQKLGVQNNDLIEIDVEGRKVELPVMEQPGMAEDVIVTEVGYGRTVTGDIGKDVGVNVNGLISEKGGLSRWIYTGAKVNKTGKTYTVYSTQEHHPVDDDFVKDLHLSRKIIQEGTVEQYKKDKKFLKHHEHDYESINPLRKYEGRKWAMSIDLNKCISCNNCVASCNVENNVPVVGKEQLANGREMQWIRLDRYYSGTPEEPKVSTQPMLCQHCDLAPCENVCPVVATNHSEDGLNQMVYNRCVGTRYCANNCPYKVRRFNFFDFRSYMFDGFYEQESIALQHNPEVTVRSRGVMEKCTFCVQRLMEARQEAIKEGREVKGDEVKTACQEACPAGAITFGNALDSESEIAKAIEHDLGYTVLTQLNIYPNVTYIAKLRNIYSEEV
jgi:Fe-S-cluster-containing dehydrogenase component/anaerobic selenocysteine-containing dehydrogenase